MDCISFFAAVTELLLPLLVKYFFPLITIDGVYRDGPASTGS